MQFDEEEEAADAEADENAKVSGMAYNLSKVQHDSRRNLENKRAPMASVETAECRDKDHRMSKKTQEREPKARRRGGGERKRQRRRGLRTTTGKNKVPRSGKEKKKGTGTNKSG